MEMHMSLSRNAVGLAVRALRDAAARTLEDLAGAAGMTASSLSRTENGLRSVEFAEAVRLAEALGIGVTDFLELAQNIERSGASAKADGRRKLQAELDELQRDAVLAAVEARALSR